MSSRLKHVLAVVMTVLILGVSSQAAVCDLACALQVHQDGCHTEHHAGYASHSDSMEMPDSHHVSSMFHLYGQDDILLTGSRMQGACHHPAMAATVRSGSTDARICTVEWSVVEVLPIAWTLLRTYRAANDPPHRSNPVDPLLLTLRV